MTERVVDAQEAGAEPVGDGGAQGTPSGGAPDDADTFPREYVERLRDESAKYRTKAQRADEAVSRLTAEMVASRTVTILADPTDLPLSDDLLGEDGWPDPEKIETAAHDLVARKPHLASRRPTGDVGQGVRGDEMETVSLAALLRAGAS